MLGVNSSEKISVSKNENFRTRDDLVDLMNEAAVEVGLFVKVPLGFLPTLKEVLTKFPESYTRSKGYSSLPAQIYVATEAIKWRFGTARPLSERGYLPKKQISPDKRDEWVRKVIELISNGK